MSPTPTVAVTRVTKRSVHLMLDGREHLLPFKMFPWFRGAPMSKVRRIERPSPTHLYWPDLDVDLAVEVIEHPEWFPRVSSVVLPRGRLRPFKPFRIRGKPMSETVIEDRRDRF